MPAVIANLACNPLSSSFDFVLFCAYSILALILDSQACFFFSFKPAGHFYHWLCAISPLLVTTSNSSVAFFFCKGSHTCQRLLFSRLLKKKCIRSCVD